MRLSRDELIRTWRAALVKLLTVDGGELPADNVLDYIAEECAKDGRPPRRSHPVFRKPAEPPIDKRPG
jgi:hypothetical protein